MVTISNQLNKTLALFAPIQRMILRRAAKPKTIQVEILGPDPKTEKWDVEKAEELLPVQARYMVPARLNKAKVMYCVFKAGENYYPVPLDRKQAILNDEPDEYLEKITATSQQIYHMEKQQVRRKRYSRKGSAMQKAQSTMYVLLAGGLGFLLFIIFSEVTDKGA